MRNRAIAAVIALSCCAAGAPVVASSASASTASVASCLKHKIHGKKVCLAQGRRCDHKYANAYRKYGFVCVKEDGKYRLVSEQQ